jgi:hypothetical protein
MRRITVTDWVNETVPPSKYRGLDGKEYEFNFGEAEILAQSGYDAFFRLNENHQWGVRWFGLHRLPGSRYVFTVGFGAWLARREVPAELVGELLTQFFTRNELTEAGRAFLR